MNPSSPPNPVPESVAAKLRAIQRRGQVVALLGGLLGASAVFLFALLGALLLDLAFGWLEPRVRYSVTGLVLALGAFALLRGCLPPFFRRRTLVGAARVVDSNLPKSEERWTTVTELAQSGDRPDVRGSDALIRQVGVEAESVGVGLEVRNVVPLRSLFGSGRWFLAAAAALAVLFVVDFADARVLMGRFLKPGSDLSLTRVTAGPGGVWVAKGEPVTVSAEVQGRIPAGRARIQVRTECGAVREVAMTPGSAGRFRHEIESVSETFEYRVRAGDGQTPWQRITAAERPRISEVRLRVVPPGYSRLPGQDLNSLPGTVRVLEGSAFEVGFRADQSLERFWLDLGDGHSLPLEAGPDAWYRWQDRPTNSFQFQVRTLNRFQLENKIKPSTRVSVFADAPPEVRLLDAEDEGAIAPGQKLLVAFEASDDLGIARAEVWVSTTTAEGGTNRVSLPVDLGAEAGKKQIRRTLELDPAKLGLKQGDQLSYAVQVTDTRQAPGKAEASDARDGRARTASASSKPDQDRDASRAKPAPGSARESEPATAAAEAKDNKPGEESGAIDAKPKAGQLAATGDSKPSESKPGEASSPPPDDMARRALDGGQCTTCKPRNIKVDEWAGAYDGDRRKKLEIAIAPILREVDAHLARAQQDSAGLRTNNASSGLGVGDVAILKSARGSAASASRVIADLRLRTTATPYAFIGLQLHNLDGAHIVPASEVLQSVVAETSAKTANREALEQAGFHLARAREMLADLTRTFETVKRDQQVADAMQRLSKMYQIFLEDTQALLGNSKGPIHSFERQIAEVDEAFVEKLKALLEEKKKIMAELARTLGDDPRLLRRYLAMLQLQGTSYRDQMTLLAERQEWLESRIRAWNTIPAADRTAFLDSLKSTYAARHQAASDAATRLRENLETWLPLDVRPDHAAVKPVLARAEQVASWVAGSTGANAGESGLRALEALRALRESMPELGRLATTNRARLDAYVANRLTEVESLITAQSGRLKIVEALEKGDFPVVAEIDQHRLTLETVALEEKLDTTETQVASMSPEIARRAADLLKIVRAEIIEPQKSTVDQLSGRDVAGAGRTVEPVVPAFARAEKSFDDLLRMIIAKLDQAPAPTEPGSAKSLESMLAMLQEEARAAESLGIPCRPMNVSIMRDWMKPGSNPGQGMGQGRGKGEGQGQAQARAARSQAEDARAESQRLEEQARQSGRQALARAKEEERGAGDAATGGRTRGEDWNKLASRLKKDLMQGRESTPPEQYRDAIANYFKTLAGAGTVTGTGTGPVKTDETGGGAIR